MKTASLIEPQLVSEGLHRSYAAKDFAEVLSGFPELVGDPELAWGWLSNHDNLLFRKDDNFGMFTFEYPGLYTAHYFFKDCRGRDALKLSREILKKLFTEHGARAVQGMTPVWNRKANWMTRQLGCTSYGEIETPEAGLCTHFIMTIDEFFEKNKGKL